MAQDLVEEFRSTQREGLQPLKDSLITVFRQLVEYDCPPEVVAFDFEVFLPSGRKDFPLVLFS